MSNITISSLWCTNQTKTSLSVLILSEYISGGTTTIPLVESDSMSLRIFCVFFFWQISGFSEISRFFGFSFENLQLSGS